VLTPASWEVSDRVGRFLEVKAEKPRYHATEEGRWDFRVTIVFRSAAAAAESSGEEEIKKQLFPDQATFQREEKRRFEILLARGGSASSGGGTAQGMHTMII
jgi:hypothetical protein